MTCEVQVTVDVIATVCCEDSDSIVEVRNKAVDRVKLLFASKIDQIKVADGTVFTTAAKLTAGKVVAG